MKALYAYRRYMHFENQKRYREYLYPDDEMRKIIEEL
jgi:hypothetical protein